MSASPQEQGHLARPNWLFISIFGLVLLYTFLLGLDILTKSVSTLAGSNLQELLKATLNPWVGLSIGILITATLQSSSAVTSILVALVASGAVSLQQAVPIVIGSNLGTTFTAFLVGLSHINSKKEFRKGIAAALVHVFFNLLAAGVFFSIEASAHVLSGLSAVCTKGFLQLFPDTSLWLGTGIRSLVSPVATRLVQASSGSWLWVIIGFSMLFGCILLFRTVLKILWMSEYASKLNNTFFANKWQSLGWGSSLTACIHSSTVTTSLVVPLSAQGVIHLRQLMPFIVGANIGTTVTALIASVGLADAGVALAFSHFLFNLIFGLIVFFVPSVSDFLLYLARKGGAIFAQKRSVALLFLILFYFAVPLVVLYVNVRFG